MYHVKVLKAADAEAAGRLAADQLQQAVCAKPACVLGLATGATPIPLYRELIRREQAGLMDFSRVRSVNLDEYKGLAPDHPQSYRRFMQENLFDHISIRPENTWVPDGMTTDVDSYMFGSILALDRADVALSVGVSAAVLVLYVLFYHRLFAITFDESFSRATGMRVELYNTVLSVLTALTIVLGMRLMGAMLISSLVIFPALTAMRLLRSFRGVVICAGVLSVVCFCAGLTGSYLLSTPVGATVVLADLAAFLLACGAAGLKKRA